MSTEASANGAKTSPPPTSQGRPGGTQTQGVQLLPLLTTYFKTVGLLLFVWFIGYYGFSATWILFGMFFYVANEQYRKVKESKKAFAKEAVLNEKAAILARVDELPSWVYFPDVERAEWLNKILKQMWPYITEYIKNYLKTNVEPMVQSSLPSSLSPFKFVKIDLGDICPRIGGIKVYTEHVKRDELIVDMELFYASDSEITVAVRGLNAGIKDLQIHGTLRVVMKPLVETIPIIGGMTVFFLNQPSVDFDLTNAANILDIPLLSSSLRTVVEDYISYFMVLPNKIPITLSDQVTAGSLRYVMPQGLIRIHCVEARDLKKADVSLFGKGKSDPYLKLYVGAQNFKTKVIKDNVNPVWNQYYEAVVDQKFGQVVEIECLDEDPGEDDELGTASIDIEQIATSGSMDSWLPLENVSTGMVHIRALWLHLSKDPADLDKEAMLREERIKEDAERGISSLEEGASEEHLSSAILKVTLDSAKSLPRQRKSMSEPSCYVKLLLGNEEKKSMVKPKTTDPTWEENFMFLIHDPRQQDLTLEVRDSGRNDKKLGRLQVPMKSLLEAPDLILHQPYPLRESGVQSTITLRLCLRILTSQLPADWAQDVMDLKLPEPAPADLPEHLEPAADTPDTTDKVKTAPTKSPTPTPATKTTVTATKTTAPATKSTVTKSPARESKKSTKSHTPATKASSAGDANGAPKSREVTPPSNNVATDNDVTMTTLSKETTPDDTVRYRGSVASSSSKWGSIELTVRYSSQRQKLVLVIHRASNLIPCDEDQLADPYVRVYLMPGKNSKKKTEPIKNNLNPIYDETFEWSMTPSDLNAGAGLLLKVKNHQGMFSRGRSDMGDLTLDLSRMNLSQAVTDWYDLEDPQDDD